MDLLPNRQRECRQIHRMLNNPATSWLRGSGLEDAPKSWAYTPPSTRRPHVVIDLQHNSEIVRRVGPSFHGLSYAAPHRRPVAHICINLENWDNPPENFVQGRTGNTRALYRRYLIMHETAHILGLHHPSTPSAPDPDRPCRIMDQLTKGTGGCRLRMIGLNKSEHDQWERARREGRLLHESKSRMLYSFGPGWGLPRKWSPTPA